MKTIVKGYWRIAKSPSKPVAMGARSCGHAFYPKGSEHGTGTIKGWTNIYWGTRGTGGPLVNGRETTIPPEHIALHYHGDRISGYPMPEDWSYSWLTVDGLMAQEILNGFAINGPWPRHVGRCPQELFDRLEKELQDVRPEAEFQASATAYEILTIIAQKLSGGNNTDTPLAEKARVHIDNNWRNAGFDINRLADLLHTHRSVISREFKKNVGVAPSEYLQRLRLRGAFSELRNPSTTIKEIAINNGFLDPAYFSRLIKDKTGFSPARLRNMF